MRVVFAVDANTMAEAYVQCEYQDAKIDLGKQAFKSYVRVGEEIRQALSTFRLSKKVRQVLSPLPT